MLKRVGPYLGDDDRVRVGGCLPGCAWLGVGRAGRTGGGAFAALAQALMWV